ncbi:MAG TPA: endolytic transglycosylase MltG, partial [Candidatus Polarisedimenticolia bacterium]|nr:endolytic transglycosylase MltG [Candidatus Polarisedimenticolia bacterium]
MTPRSMPKKTLRRRGSKRQSALRTFFIFSAVFLWVPVVMGLVLYYLWAEVPFRGYDGPRILVEVPRAPSHEILRLLQDRGILREGPFGRVYLAVTGRGRRLQAGEYMFEGPMTAPQVFRKLVRGDIYYHRVTVPEGLRSGQIFMLFRKEGFGKEEEFRQEFLDTSRIEDLDPEATDLEGYLYPDTYALAKGTTAKQIVDKMVANHRQIWTEEWRARAAELDMSPRQVVTLASLIEKETGQAQERAVISSVFHNRLQKGMKLQCDPTIIFALVMRDRYRGMITRSDLRIQSRYNTYAFSGLPPGPIANPGRDSIEAALRPQETDYLYFVSMNNGRHTFSASLDE